MTRSLAIATFLAVTAVRAGGQSLLFAPAETDADRIRLLTAGPSRGTAIETRALAQGDTNVLALSRGGDSAIPRTRFGGTDAHFLGYRYDSVGLSRGAWSLSYAFGTADLFTGNGDAAQLYLDARAKAIDTQGVYRPTADMNRTAAHRFRLRYESALPHVREAWLAVSANWLRIHRVQLGQLAGDTINGQFVGLISLLTTEGVPPDDARSSGLTFDLAGGVRLARDWRVAAWLDNAAGWIWQRRMQQIDANVSTNTLAPDSDGFLHGVPLLEGSVRDAYASPDARRRFALATAYTRAGRQWLGMLSSDTDWRSALGVRIPAGRRAHFWLLGGIDPFLMQAGYETEQLRVSVGLSTLNPDEARSAMLSVAWRLPLHTP